MAVFAMSAMGSSATNYFVPGTVWEYQMPGDPGPQVIYSLSETDETESEGIYQVVFQYPHYDRYGNTDGVTEGGGIPVKLEGEKVYAYVTWGGNTGWQLIYDFSLKPGEGCWIKETANYATSEGMHVNEDLYFKYVGNVYNEWYDTEVMELKVFRTEEESTDDSNSVFEVYWIPEIGSLDDIFGHYRYPEEKDMCSGPGTYLTKVTDADGNVIVEFGKRSGIGAVEAEDCDAPAAYFDLHGRRISNPGHGLYILRHGEKASKVIL